MITKCRVLNFPLKDALYNTAIDQYLLERASKGEFSIAFTEWKPSVLVGNSQSLALDVDLTECQKRGVLITRRFSGGKSVHINGNHIVFTLAGPRQYFLTSLVDVSVKLRRQPCEAAIRALKRFGVPADFFKPDHVVILSSGGRIRALGSSGQVIRQTTVAVGTTLRYSLPDETLQEMLAVLKINGRSLAGLFGPVREALAWIKEFATVSADDIKTALVEEIVKEYDLEGWYSSSLKPAENLRIEELALELFTSDRFKDKPEYGSRGICDLYLNGWPNIPEIDSFLSYSRPSTAADSTL